MNGKKEEKGKGERGVEVKGEKAMREGKANEQHPSMLQIGRRRNGVIVVKSCPGTCQGIIADIGLKVS